MCEHEQTNPLRFAFCILQFAFLHFARRSLEENGGYLGPWLDVEGYYTGPFRKFSDVQEVLEEPFGELLEIISGRVVKGVVERVTKEIYPKVFRPPLVKSFDMCLEDGAPGIIG